MDISESLERWVGAQLIDGATADRIREFERASGKGGGIRWPAIFAIGFGALMLCAGVLLFVAAHWDHLSPSERFGLVLAMVAVFHLTAGALGEKVPSVGAALHLAGSVCLGAGIYMAGQIFNLEAHWPSGVMLWSLGAVLGWLVLRQWPQALLAAVLIPCWLGSEWALATTGYRGGLWNIAAQGFLLLCIFYLSVTPRSSDRALRLGVIWVGGILLIPFIGDVMFTGRYSNIFPGGRPGYLPSSLMILGYAAAYVPVLVFAAIARRKKSFAMFASAAWVLLFGMLSQHWSPGNDGNPWIYLWIGLGACALCAWGVRENRILFINLGTAVFALNAILFYFADVLDKMGRSMALILLGAIFLAGGWVLNRLRGDLIARAAAGGSHEIVA